MKKLLITLPILLGVNLVFGAQRLVLFEEVTNASCPPCATYNPGMEAMLEQLGDTQVILLSYHGWWPGFDPMYNANVVDNTARIQYYSVNAAPSAIIDGIINGNMASPASMQTDILSRYSLPTPFVLNLTSTFNQGQLDIQADVSVEAGANPNDLNNSRIHIVVTESLHYSSPPGSNGETEFPNALIKMLPDANGEGFTLAAGGSQTFTRTIPVDSNWELENVRIIAFVQDNASKEVKQAATVSFLGGTVYGTITDANGNPLDNVAVITPAKTVYTNQIGTYEIGTFAGSQDISFYKFGYEAVTQTISVNNTTNFQADQTLQNSQVGSFNGTITDASNGSAIPNIEVQLIANDSLDQVILTEMTDANGTFNFNQVPISAQGFLEYHTVILTPEFNYPISVDSSQAIVITANNQTTSNWDIPQAEFLIVSDDNNTESQMIFEEALNLYSVPFFTWDIDEKGQIDNTKLSTLLKRNVIWSTSETPNGFSTSDITTCETFLQNGGNLVLAGVDIFDDINGTNFESNFIGATRDGSGQTHNFIRGVPTSDIASGKLFNTAINNSQPNRDALTVSTATVGLGYGPAGTFAPALVYNEGANYKVVASGFSLEGIGNPNGTPSLKDLDFLLSEISNWFSGNVSVPDFSNPTPNSFAVSQNYPNPFNPSTKIDFNLPSNEEVTVAIFNLKGEKVNEILNANLPQGTHSVVWDGKDLNGNLVSSGTYFYKVETSEFSETRKMILLK
ncbi:MAG: T9SS C-terminal target domain-containing protein [Calditrichaeota bacterium]|nr:MAG: T9SS C-terminal target domain-containing protein [Calditrichota bacterium]